VGNVDGKGIDVPANEQVWESWIQHLLGKKYGNSAKAYGSRGHKQHGIDFTVFDGSVRLGVQCKFVSPDSKLNVPKVAEDIEASRAVNPRIGRFLLYSSAKSEPKTSDALDALKIEAATRGIEFEWFLRREFEEEVRTYDLFDRLNGLGGLAPASTPAQAPGQAATRPTQEATSVVVQSAAPVQAAASVFYSQMLDEVKELLGARDSAGAMALVDAVLKRASQVPSTELARAYATKAILISRAGQISESAKYWRLAAEIEPDPNLRHGRRAQAFLSEDRFEEALEAALPGLGVDPPSSLSALAALSAGQHLGRRAEIDVRLNARLKAERDIGLIRAHVALADGELAIAEDLADIVDKAYPDDADITCLRADILLHKALGGSGRLRAEVITGAELIALESALPLYRRSLAQRDPHRDRAGWEPSALNYLSTLKLLERHEEAGDLALEITNAFGIDADDIGRVLLALAEGGKQARALELAGQLPDGGVKVSMARASAFLHQERFGEAEKLLEEILGEASGQDADNIAWMLVAARMQTRPGANLAELASVFYDAADNKLAACARLVENATRLGYPQLTEEYAARALALYEMDPVTTFLPLVADSLLALKRYDDAIQLLLPQVDLENPQGGPLEERLAFCLLHRHRIESLGKLLAGLSPSAPDAIRFDPYRIDYAFARGDRLAALAAIHEAMKRRPGDLKLNALEIALLREQDCREEAEKKLLAAEFQLDAPLRAVALFVHEARELHQDDLADDFAYQWIRKRGSDTESAAWFLTDFLASRRKREPLQPLPEVSQRCGVCLVPSDSSQKSRWVVIDDRYPESTAAGWFAPHSERIPDLIGKTPSSVVDFRGYPGGPFTIDVILSVADGAFKLIQSRYGSEVPMADSLRYFSLKGEGEEMDLSPIFKMLDDSKEAAKRALSIYAQAPMPIGVVAHAMQRDPIDFWAGLVGSEHSVRAMSGDTATASVFARQLEGGPPNIVLDPVTLMGWEAFGLLHTARRAVSTISMPVSAVDLIKRKRDEHEPGDSPKMVLSASEEAGRYLRTEVTPEMRAAERQVFDRVIEWIENNVQVVPTPSSGLPEEVYSRMSQGWPAYIADSLQLAAYDGRVLVADDIGLEALSAASRVMQVPTAALLRAASTAKSITRAEFSHALRELAAANYEFISFNADDLWAVTDTKAFTVTPDVAVMLRYLRIKSLNVPSGLHVVRQYLRKLAESGVATRLFAGCMTIALSSVSRHATRDTELVFCALARTCLLEVPQIYSQAALTSLLCWLRGHFLTRADVGIAAKAEPPKKRQKKRRR
jgi:tetratricopeptide (TPR) repeat protein